MAHLCHARTSPSISGICWMLYNAATEMFDESHTARPALDCVSGQQRGTSMGHVLECVYLKASFWCSVWGIPLPPAQQGEHLRGSALETKPIPKPGVQWRWKQTSAMPQNRRVPNKLVVLFLTSFIRTNITPTMREQQDTAQTRACLSSSASGWEGLGGWGGGGECVCVCVGVRGCKTPHGNTNVYIPKRRGN